jgi:hypothetical protein
LILKFTKCFAALDTTCDIIFVTSTFFTGNLGGIDGADYRCRERALGSSASLVREISSDFIAIISNSTVNAIDRVNTTRCWRNVLDDDVQYANAANWGRLEEPVLITEKGTSVADSVATELVWTGEH